MKELLKQKQTRNLLELLETFFIAATFCVVIYLTIAVPNKVEGMSMEPNFHENDLVITNKTVQYIGETDFGKSRNYDYHRGDVIIINHDGTDIIKRIIALEGESVEIKNNHVYVNGSELEEDYIPTTSRTKLPAPELSFFRQENAKTVPENSYFVLGDNREQSKDSRFRDVGFVSRKQVKGRVMFRYWPLSQFGLVRRGETR